MNPTILSEDCFTTALINKWKEWRQAKRHYPEVTVRWERHVKHRLQILSRQHEVEKKKGHERNAVPLVRMHIRYTTQRYAARQKETIIIKV